MVCIEDLDCLCLSLMAYHLDAEDIFNMLQVSSSFGKRFVNSVTIINVDTLDARLKYCKDLNRLMVSGLVDLGSLSTLIGHLPQLHTVVASQLVPDSVPSSPDSLKQLRILNSYKPLTDLDVKKLSTHLSPNAVLFLACELGFSELIKSALDNGASWRQIYDFCDEEWEYIIENHYSPMLYFAYAHQALKNEWRILEYAEMGGNLNAKHTSSTSPLLVATCRKNFELVDFLVALGASVDDPGYNMSPVLASIIMNDKECLLKLISLGLDVNRHLGEDMDKTSLQLACSHGAEECVSILIEAGATVTADCMAFCIEYPNIYSMIEAASPKKKSIFSFFRSMVNTLKMFL